METNKILEAEKVTDRDIFNFITDKMVKQGQKSQEQWYDEELDKYEAGDTCQYFGYDNTTDTNLRCAVGFIMNPNIFVNYQNEFSAEIEGSGIAEKAPLEVVILSNSNWQFTKESWVMLSIMQRIHDNINEYDWKNIFLNMSYLFDADGKFQPTYVIKDESGYPIDKEKLFDVASPFSDDDETDEDGKEFFVDFEELGISLKIPKHNGTIVSRISNAIQSMDKSCFDQKAIGLNILDAENQQTADASAMNFLDLVDLAKANKPERELMPNAGQ